MKNNSIKFVIMALLLSVTTLYLISIPITCDQCFVSNCADCFCNDDTLTCNRCGNDSHTGYRSTVLSNFDINKAIFRSAFSASNNIISAKEQADAKTNLSKDFDYKKADLQNKIDTINYRIANEDVGPDDIEIDKDHLSALRTSMNADIADYVNKKYKKSKAYKKIDAYMQKNGIDVCSDTYSAKYVKNYNGQLVALMPDPSNPNLSIADAAAWGS